MRSQDAVIGQGFTQWIGLYFVYDAFALAGVRFDDALPSASTSFLSVRDIFFSLCPLYALLLLSVLASFRRWRDCPFTPSTQPPAAISALRKRCGFEKYSNAAILCLQLFISLHILNAGFYWTHRLLHSKSLYARFHKQHHEYTGTISFAAEYAHPLEAIFRLS